MPELKTYTVESSDGKIYEIEGPEGATAEQLGEFITSQAQEPVATEGPSFVPNSETDSVQPVEDSIGLTPFDQTDGTVTQASLATRNRPDISGYVNALWNAGHRDPDKMNELIRNKFPDSPFTVSKGSLAGARRRDAYYKARGVENPGNFIATEPTGIEDPETPDSIGESFLGGVKRGLAGTANAVTGLGALGADLVGADETSDALLEKYIEDSAKTSFNYPSPVESSSDIDSFGDASLYAVDALGELAPSLVGSMGSGALGKEVAQKFVKEATGKTVRKAQIAGAAAYGASQETGQTFGKTYEKTGEKAPFASIAAGVASGSLDAILPIRALDKLGVTKEFKKSILKAAAKEGGKDFLIEGGTEALQEFITALPEAYITGESPFTAEMFEQMKEAFIKGGIGGGVVGAAGGAYQNSRTPVKPVEDVEAEATIIAPEGGKRTKKYKKGLERATEQVVNHVNMVTESWSGGPEFTVHENFKSLDGIDNNAIGVFQEDGTVAINTEAVLSEAKRRGTTPDAIVSAVTYHEGLGHFGLAKEFGENLDRMMTDLYTNSNSDFKAMVDDWMAKRPDAYKDRPFREELATEEILAEMSEGGPIPVSFMNRVANLIKDTARKAGLNVKYSKREIQAILGMAHGAVMNGKRDDVAGNGFKYMMPSKDRLSPDDLFESLNAIDILNTMTESYQAEPMSLDTIQSEAALRGFTAQNFLRTNPKEAGDLSRRLVMYDIAMEKLNEKITKLYGRIQSGESDANTAAEYAKTLVRFEEMSSRMFGEQSEIGRALRVIQELNYTHKKAKGLKDVLGGMTESDLTTILSDPETLAKFSMEIQGQLDASKERLDASGIKNVATNLLNVPRALMSSMDLSAPLRQGVFFVGRKEFYSSFIRMFKYFGSDSAYKEMMFDITRHPNYQRMSDANLAFSNANGKLSQKEEDFMTNYADWVPGVKRSERAYTGFLTKMRVDTFNNLLEKYEEAGVDIDDPVLLKGLARFINSATGRGDLGKWNSAAPQLNSIFFSPRLIASRVNMLNPAFYVNLPAPVRKEAIKSLLSFGAIATTVISLANAAGADVEDDPRSTDFGKIRVGDTRYDVLGGFGQYITLGARLASKQKMTGNGNIRELNSDEYKAENRGDVLGKFLTNKFSPVTSYLWGYLTGKNAIGEDFVPQDEAIQRMTPMFVGDLMDMGEKYGYAKGGAMASPALFGVGVQDYASYALDPTRKLKAPETFTRSDEPDQEDEYLSIRDGVVHLKEDTREQWTTLLNQYIEGWMAEEMADPSWETKTDQEKADIIKDVRSEARKSAKEDMLESLGF